jgi:hypothetical protein
MNTLNEKGMQRLQDWLLTNCKYPPTYLVDFNAWAAKAEESCPPYLEIKASDSLSGSAVTLRFAEDEYWIEEADEDAP